MKYTEITTTYELKAEYDLETRFWKKARKNWKIFFRNPWRYWRSHVNEQKLVKKLSQQIADDIDKQILKELQFQYGTKE